MATVTKECVICQGEFQNPILLPCIHSFCLECLEQYCRNKLPGDDVPCPVCRTDFIIPKNGVANLPVRTYSEPKGTSLSATREKCIEHEDLLRMYCLDCRMKVCSTCCFETHKTHNYERYEQTMEKFVRSIDDDIQPVTSRVKCFRAVAAQVEAERNKLSGNINAVEKKIKDRAQHVIQTVELQMRDYSKNCSC